MASFYDPITPEDLALADRIADEVFRPSGPPPPRTVIRFSDRHWRRLRKVEQEFAQFLASCRQHRPERDWGASGAMNGLLGEAVFSAVSGLAWSPEKHLAWVREHGIYDGGVDFPVPWTAPAPAVPRIDVKSTAHAPPWLKIPARYKLHADFYALVLLEPDRQGGTYIGYASRSELDAAPAVEYGRGVPARTLKKVNGGFPPGLPLAPRRSIIQAA